MGIDSVTDNHRAAFEASNSNTQQRIFNVSHPRSSSTHASSDMSTSGLGSSNHGECQPDRRARTERHAKSVRNMAAIPRHRRARFATDTPQKRVEARVSPIDTVPLIPFPPSPVDKIPPVERRHQHAGFRHDYVIGDALRSPSHMIVDPSSERSLAKIGALQEHDFAFVRRSDGSFSYAILAYRHASPVKGARGRTGKGSTEECLTFVVSEIGTTKMVRRRFWSKFVRLVRAPPADGPRVEERAASTGGELERPVLCQEIESHDDSTPPKTIAFVPPDFNEECSLISSVSDRARGLARRRGR